MILIFFLTIVFLLIVVINCLGNQRPDVLLNRDATDEIKGVFAIGIMISHIATHMVIVPDSYVEKIFYYGLCFLGTAAVGVFFFFSGYANYLSIKNKNKIERVYWLSKQLTKVLITLFVCIVTVAVFLSLLGKPMMLFQLFCDYITLTMPYTTTWYLKIQVLLYLMLFASSFLKEKFQIVTLIIMSVIYIIVMIQCGFDDYWWNTILCFPAGALFGHCSKITNTVSTLYRGNNLLNKCCLMLSVLFLYMLNTIALRKNPLLEIILCIILTLMIVVVMCLLNSDLEIFRRIGKYSFELYLVHITLVSTLIGKYVIAKDIIVFALLSVCGAFISHHVAVKLLHFVMNKAEPVIRDIKNEE